MSWQALVNRIGSQVPSIDLVNPPQLSKLGGDAQPSQAFTGFLEDAVARVQETRVEADTRTHRFLQGEPEELHQVVLATQQAELEFEMFQQVRNKVVQAYQEVMRMQL